MGRLANWYWYGRHTVEKNSTINHEETTRQILTKKNINLSRETDEREFYWITSNGL